MIQRCTLKRYAHYHHNSIRGLCSSRVWRCYEMEYALSSLSWHPGCILLSSIRTRNWSERGWLCWLHRAMHQSQVLFPVKPEPLKSFCAAEVHCWTFGFNERLQGFTFRSVMQPASSYKSSLLDFGPFNWHSQAKCGHDEKGPKTYSRYVLRCGISQNTFSPNAPYGPPL